MTWTTDTRPLPAPTRRPLALSVTAAARELGVSPDVVRRLVKNGLLPTVPHLGRRQGHPLRGTRSLRQHQRRAHGGVGVNSEAALTVSRPGVLPTDETEAVNGAAGSASVTPGPATD